MNQPLVDASDPCCDPPASSDYSVEQTVKERYADGARQVEPALCCPTSYDPKYLALLPQEIIEKDYGCGDPSQYVGQGETALDLGSGTGKVCYILSQKVGSKGHVIGVDFNPAMLEVARKHQDALADKIGWHNTAFHKGRIQDLALDLDAAQTWLNEHPLASVEDVAAYEAHCDHLRQTQPMVANDSVDVIVSNCVLNLVETQQKQKLFAEMFRVLKVGGRCVISDIVCDETPTPRIMNDPDLWSGCISGAFEEAQFLKMFEDAGFHGIEILKREADPWHTLDGIEFRSMTVRAYKGKQGPCLERKQAVVYLGPWRRVHDDDGHVLCRGQRMAVCDKTFNLLTDPAGPYAGQFAPVLPLDEVAMDQAQAFDCKRSACRHPRETKGRDYDVTTLSDEACCVDGTCC